MPIDGLMNAKCLDYYDIAHDRGEEGYVETWYDRIDADESYHYYKFVPPRYDGPLYFTVETYSYNIIPYSCTTGYTTNDLLTYYPLAYMMIRNGDIQLSTKYYMDYGHDPYMTSAYNAGDEIFITVQYEWMGSPHKDYTLKVYSKHEGANIVQVDSDSKEIGSNQLFTDGRSPSEFTDSSFTGYQDCCTALGGDHCEPEPILCAEDEQLNETGDGCVPEPLECAEGE
jgi:hypothetical protein